MNKYLVIIAALLCGCPHQTPTNSPLGGRGALPSLPEIRSYSETRPITSVAVLSGHFYGGTPWGLLRFDRKTGSHTRLTTKDGLPGNRIYGVSGDSATGLWITTNGGLAQLQGSTWKTHKVSPRIGQPTAALLVSGKNVWVGGSRGLGLYDGSSWKVYLPGARVTYMLEDLVAGGVWVGTASEGVYHFEKKKFVSHSVAHGQDIRAVRSMTYTPDGGLLVAGQTKKGAQRLTFYDGRYWTSYELAPGGQINWVQQVDSDILLSYDRYLLKLKRMKLTVRRPGMKEELQPEGPVALKGTICSDAPSGYPSPRFYTEPSGTWLPPDATAVVGYSRQIVIGTRTTGLVVYDGRVAMWYRTNDLFGSNGRLKMACSADGVCYLPGAEGRAFRHSDKGFEAITVGNDAGSTIHGFASDSSGAVISLHSPTGGKNIVVSRLVGGKFVRLYEVKGSIPSGEVEVRFVRVDPAGRLWVGVWYQDKDGDRTPWGVAVLRKPPPTPAQPKQPASQPASQPVNPPPPAKAPPAKPGKEADPSKALAAAGGKLVEVDVERPLMYHRSTLLPDEDRVKGSLALPDDIRDVFFDNTTIWLATGLGACRVVGTEVKIFDENDGLASELIYGVIRSPDDNNIMVATYSGVGRFKNKKWYFNMEEPLDSGARAFIRQSKTLWIGTFRGVVQLKQGKVRVFNDTIGLVSNNVMDLHLAGDQMWVLTDKGVSMVKVPK